MRETFSSELRGVDQRPGDSFSNEFRGASASLIDRDRPPRPLDVGRRSRRLIVTLFVLVGLLGGGGWALWYWSEPIGEWIASWNPGEGDDSAGSAEPDAAASAQPPEPASPSPELVSPEPASPSPGPASPSPEPPAPAPIPGPIPGELPVEPLDRVEPAGGEGLPSEALDAPPTGPTGAVERVSVVSTTIRGRVSDARVTARLAGVDEALRGCWLKEAAAHGRPAELSLRFTIKWNGRLLSTSVDGDAPVAVERCVREALPASGWPMPSDGGEARVNRQWKLR